MFGFEDLTKKINLKARRSSSYDVTGGNADSSPVAPHAKRVLFEAEACGEVRHIWMAVCSDDVFVLRRAVIRMYWDGEETPSVVSPVGDFFGLGHSRGYTHSNAAFSTSSNDNRRLGEGAALNSWIPMPFSKSAKIELENDSDIPLNVYYYVDWREKEPSDGKVYTLHASWRREDPTALTDDGSPEFAAMKNGKNLTDRYNYRILYAEGEGNFLGVSMSIDNREGEWWGEGDDMFFIDREDMTRDFGGTWPPDLHGTGSEDYFTHAWGMQHVQGLYSGEAWCEDNNFERAHNCNGKVVEYRFHIADPVPFEKNIRVSIEHGHANDREDDVASVAYWYQAEPHSPLSFDELPDADGRLPKPSRTDRRIAGYLN